MKSQEKNKSTVAKKRTTAARTPSQKIATPQSLVQRAISDPSSLGNRDWLQIQGAIGNKRTIQLMRQENESQFSRTHNKTPVSIQRQPSLSRKASNKQQTMVQRAIGLPSRKSVETEIGKAGGVFGWTTWKKILKTLDAYAALKENDTAGKKKVLSQMQAHTRTWMASYKKRVKKNKVKTNDKKKMTFINDLIPQMNIMYYQMDTKARTVDRALVNARQYADDNFALAKSHISDLGLSTDLSDIDNINSVLSETIDELKGAELTYNFSPNVLNFYLDDPYMKTNWELKWKDQNPPETLGDIDKLGGKQKEAQQREKAERYLGYEPFKEEQRYDRPVYLAVNVTGNKLGGAKDYGMFYFVMKEQVKDRSTFTAQDTFAMSGGKVKVQTMNNNGEEETVQLGTVSPDRAIASNEHMESLLAYNHRLTEYLVRRRMGMKITGGMERMAQRFYVEAQVHGGVSLNDVEAIVVSYSKDNKKWGPIDKDYKALVDNFISKYPSIKVRYQEDL